ncbi:ion transporter [Streptomyces sp. BI20]|uniref:ion transporter n=1 Tax=Streptomyces sp. BI20 TaxID=3403460 RepID=UPI003C729447
MSEHPREPEAPASAPPAGSASGVRARLAGRCRLLTEARWFALLVLGVILVNALLLGAETYSGLVAAWSGPLRIAEHACLAFFVIEILLRLGAHADRPRAFARDPWNLFDLAVVVCAFLPFVRENATVLRLLRLARVLRTARFLPRLRIVLVAVGRSLPGTAGFLLVGGLVVYVYAMVGWVCFGEREPEHFGSVGRAALTLFLLVTLDGIGDAVRAGLEISRWSLLYYGSYVLLSSFVLVNVLIGVVLGSLEEAHAEDRRRRERTGERADGTAEAAVGGADGGPALADRIAEVRVALDALERDLARAHAPGPGPRAD